MADHLTPERRSWNMGRIRGKNTKPELRVRSVLHRMGYRFTVNGPRNKKLPGKPDVVLPSYEMVIFVHGCFWHRHTGCKNSATPKTRTEWWEKKFNNTLERDERNRTLLEESGWKVLVIWECETKIPDFPELLGKSLFDLIDKTQ